MNWKKAKLSTEHCKNNVIYHFISIYIYIYTYTYVCLYNHKMPFRSTIEDIRLLLIKWMLKKKCSFLKKKNTKNTYLVLRFSVKIKMYKGNTKLVKNKAIFIPPYTFSALLFIEMCGCLFEDMGF